MAFQFLCPQGHLLQGESSQMGQTINCPTCGILFVIPIVAPAGGQSVAATAAPSVAPAPPAPSPPPPPSPPEEEFPDLNLRKRRSRRLAVLDELAAEEPSGETAAEELLSDFAAGTSKAFDPVESGPRLVHIDCPQGHDLITPLDTMGQEALCPHCGAQFTLRYEETREYKTKHYWKEEARQQKLGRQWLMWAVIVGVLVLLMFIGMIAFAAE